MILSIIIFVFGICCAIQLAFWAMIASSNATSKKEQNSTSQPMVSIVVAAKNEENNLPLFLPKLLQQDYSNLEIIIVNDHSTDGTQNLLDAFSKENKNLKVIHLNERKGGKKRALTIGIKAAQGTWIAQTDADCYPETEQWVSNVISQSQDAEVILLYGPYQNEGGWLNKMIRYETWYIAVQYLGLLPYGVRYMGVGRNLFFKKELFHTVEGYASHIDKLSGDDDLFISSLPAQTRVITNYQDRTYSIPKRSFGSLINQKLRHLSTSSDYRLKEQVVLSLIYLSQLGFYIGMFCLLILSQTWAIGVFIIRTIIVLIVSNRLMKKLNERNLWYFSPVMDFILVLYYAMLTLLFPFKANKKW